MNEFVSIAYLFLPLIGGLVLHGFCMKYGWLSSLAHPIDRGGSWRGKPLFGANKTYRGIVAVGLGSGLVFGLQASLLHRIAVFRNLEIFDYATINGWLIGFIFGAAAMLGELPNSLLKRQLGIAPGQSSRGVAEVVFYIIDQIDMLFGMWIVLAFFIAVTLKRVVLSAIFLFVVHQIITVVGYYLGMRATKR